MHAVKPVYNNGAVKFIKKPRYVGKFEILVIFPDKDDGENDFDKKVYFQGTVEMDKILDAEPQWQPKRFIEGNSKSCSLVALI